MEQRLREIKEKFKECSSPCANQDIEALRNYMKIVGVVHPEIPKELVSMWNLSSEWHLIHDHYDVFGFNVFGPKKLVDLTACVFGDNEIRQEWEQELGPDSCAHIDWLCFASYSEYDYIFVNLNKDSTLFGATKHMVNNCNQENIATQAPFINFIDYMETRAENYREDD